MAVCDLCCLGYCGWICMMFNFFLLFHENFPKIITFVHCIALVVYNHTFLKPASWLHSLSFKEYFHYCSIPRGVKKRSRRLMWAETPLVVHVNPLFCWCMKPWCRLRVQNNGWLVAIFTPFSYNGQPNAICNMIQLYRWPIKMKFTANQIWSLILYSETCPWWVLTAPLNWVHWLTCSNCGTCMFFSRLFPLGSTSVLVCILISGSAEQLHFKGTGLNATCKKAVFLPCTSRSPCLTCPFLLSQAPGNVTCLPWDPWS